MQKILTVKDVKEILGCGINRAYDIVNQRDFPKIKIGKRFYIPEDEFEKWLRFYLRKNTKLCKKLCIKFWTSYKWLKINVHDYLIKSLQNSRGGFDSYHPCSKSLDFQGFFYFVLCFVLYKFNYCFILLDYCVIMKDRELLNSTLG